MLSFFVAGRESRAFALLFCLVVVLSGCETKTEIRAYDIPLETPDRMLGAIVLRDDAGWFFKLTGPKAEIDQVEPEFREFLSSLKFAPQSDTPPKWTLPKGWSVDPQERELRVATLLVPLASGEKELTITVLPRDKQTPDDQYLLSNINRWRGQLGRHKLQVDELPHATEKAELDSSPGWIVKIAGQAKPGGGSMAPFAGS